ncbi:ArsR/SmtB family transcription factor [Myxococcota bacterium]
MDTIAPVLKALSEETRLQITALLIWQGELCVCDVEGVLGVSQSKASRHLRYLLNAGLVKNRRAGLWMHYYIPKELPSPQKQVMAMLRRMFAAEEHDELKSRLGQWVEQKQVEGEAC